MKGACELLGKSRATLHRQRNPKPAPEKERPAAARAAHPAALGDAERAAVLAVLDSERFADKSPAQAWAVLLDEGCYLCSIRTMYRILDGAGQVRERRAQAAHPPRVRPELVATGPGQVWTWDITKLKGPWRGLYFDLYAMLDIFSRRRRQSSRRLSRSICSIRITCPYQPPRRQTGRWRPVSRWASASARCG